jgi:hypothetical protein
MESAAVFQDEVPRSTVPSQETILYIMKAHQFTSQANTIRVSKLRKMVISGKCSSDKEIERI